MAKRGAPSKRALERGAIQAKYKNMSAYKLENLYAEKKLDLKDMLLKDLLLKKISFIR